MCWPLAKELIMRQSVQTLGLALFIVVGLIITVIGLLPGMNPWISVVMVAVLLLVFVINKRQTSKHFVAWKDEYSVGIETIDDDHKKLLTLINNLQTAVYYPTGEAFERQALKDLVEYTKYHFEREEKMMLDNEYPDYEPHKAQHEAMIAKVQNFCKAYENDPEGTIQEMTGFLRDWLINHIAGTDQKYCAHLHARGVR